MPCMTFLILKYISQRRSAGHDTTGSRIKLFAPQSLQCFILQPVPSHHMLPQSTYCTVQYSSPFTSHCPGLFLSSQFWSHSFPLVPFRTLFHSFLPFIFLHSHLSHPFCTVLLCPFPPFTSLTSWFVPFLLSYLSHPLYKVLLCPFPSILSLIFSLQSLVLPLSYFHISHILSKKS